jgi:pectinesterase inhibitor-like protein
MSTSETQSGMQSQSNPTMASLEALLRAATLLGLLVIPHACTAAAAASTTVQEQCEGYAGGDRSSYEYCVYKLGRDSGSAGADARGLAAIAARAARATAKATGERVAALRANETVPAAQRPPLAVCAAEYAAAVRRLGRAARAAARREGGDLRRAQALLEEVTGTTARCDGAFAAAGLESPLDGAARGLDDEVELAIALLPSPSPPSPPPRA